MLATPGTNDIRRIQAVWLTGGLLCAACALVGCDERPRPPVRYSVLAGHVVGCYPDTGELTICGLRRTTSGPTEAATYCLVTRDTEIYINDRLSSIEEIQIGDPVELIGRPDPDPQLERFVIAFAYLDQPLPAPPTPELAAPIEPEELQPPVRREE